MQEAQLQPLSLAVVMAATLVKACVEAMADQRCEGSHTSIRVSCARKWPDASWWAIKKERNHAA